MNRKRASEIKYAVERELEGGGWRLLEDDGVWLLRCSWVDAFKYYIHNDASDVTVVVVINAESVCDTRSILGALRSALHTYS